MRPLRARGDAARDRRWMPRSRAPRAAAAPGVRRARASRAERLRRAELVGRRLDCHRADADPGAPASVGRLDHDAVGVQPLDEDARARPPATAAASAARLRRRGQTGQRLGRDPLQLRAPGLGGARAAGLLRLAHHLRQRRARLRDGGIDRFARLEAELALAPRRAPPPPRAASRPPRWRRPRPPPASPPASPAPRRAPAAARSPTPGRRWTRPPARAPARAARPAAPCARRCRTRTSARARPSPAGTSGAALPGRTPSPPFPKRASLSPSAFRLS